MKRKSFYVWLVVIFALALGLRLYRLESVPYGVTPDELSQGYTALSLVKTGKDEWGELNLWFFKSFLDYKSPVLTYMMTAPVYVFGLSVWSIRLVPAVMGAIGCVFLALFFAKLCSRDGGLELKPWQLIPGGLLAISFWHISFSRMALEANVAMSLFFIGAYFYLEAKNKAYVVFSFVMFALSMLTYHATKIFVPGMFLALMFYRDGLDLKAIRKNVIYLMLIGVVFIGTVGGKAAARSWDLSIMSYLKYPPEIVKDVQYRSQMNEISPTLTRVLTNKVGFVVDNWFENYISYYSPAFWFAEGGREITYAIIPGTGLLAWWMVVPLGAGFVYLIQRRRYKLLAFLFFWALLAGIPASLTKEGYRPNRAIGFMGWHEIVSAFGLYYLHSLTRHKAVLKTVVVAVATVSLAFFLNDYVYLTQIKYPTHMSRHWREAFEYLHDSGVTTKYDKVFLERDGQKQAGVAFFFKVDPVEFQKASRVWEVMLVKNPQVQYLDQLNGYTLGKFVFARLAFPEMREKNSLYMTSDLGMIPNDAKVVKTIESPTKRPLIKIFTFDEKD